MYGEFLSWDLAEAGSQLPLKPGQSVAVAVGVRVKLDFSGQESLLQELNDGEPGGGVTWKRTQHAHTHTQGRSPARA